MVVIDRERCVGCGKCAAMVMRLPSLGGKDQYEFYQDPVEADKEFVNDCILDCWAGCIFFHKDIHTK